MHTYPTNPPHLLKEQNKLYFKTLFLQSQSRSVGRKKCKSYPRIFGNLSKHLKVWENDSWIKGNTQQCVCLKQWCPFLSNIPFCSPNSYNMIQYATAHLKVLESEGKECQKPSHLHFLLYNAFLALDKSSIHVAIHSIETTHTLGLRSLPLQFRCRDIWLFIIVNIFSLEITTK